MAYYAKTERKFKQAKESSNRDAINILFDNFVRNNNSENYGFLYQRAIKMFGSQITTDIVEDQLQDIYLSMLIFPEEQLLKMEETDLIRIFRSICNSPATVGGIFQKIKYRNNVSLDDL